jgi:hypothetical protein
VILEGTVVSRTPTPDATTGPTIGVEHRGSDYTPHVTFEDLPNSHFTHDFNVHVQPDPTPDNRYTNLLGVQVRHPVSDPCARERKKLLLLRTANPTATAAINSALKQLQTGACTPSRLPDTRSRQTLIEVEWESGLGADNDGNPCAATNRRGESCGFASSGHARGQEIWNWPTEGDHVHVEGTWIWDRGHPPALTEIHAPRLMAVQRKLPDLVHAPAPGIVAATANYVATRGQRVENLPRPDNPRQRQGRAGY